MQQIDDEWLDAAGRRFNREDVDDPKVVSLPGQGPLKFEPTPFVWRDPSTLPPRRFLYGHELRRKQLSATVAPGAAGKTTLKVGRALCMATNRDLLGFRSWGGPYRVWLWNLEDELEEVEKTVHAFMKFWNLTADDIGDRLFLDGVDSPSSPLLKLAVPTQSGSYTIQRPVSEALIDAMLSRKIDYLDVDPFVSSHSIEENDNGAIDAVAKEWLQIARRTDAAIGLTHHLRKIDGREATSQDARGASAMVAAARSCLVLNRMSTDNAGLMGIPECDRRYYFSVLDDKNNKAPPPTKAIWYHFVGIDLGNGDDTGPSDNIGVVERWAPPDAFGGVTARQLRHVQDWVEANPEASRKHSASPLWVGKGVAFILDLNLDDKTVAARVKVYLGTWLSTGALRTETRKNAKSDMVDYVVVGRLVDPDET